MLITNNSTVLMSQNFEESTQRFHQTRPLESFSFISFFFLKKEDMIRERCNLITPKRSSFSIRNWITLNFASYDISFLRSFCFWCCCIYKESVSAKLKKILSAMKPRTNVLILVQKPHKSLHIMDILMQGSCKKDNLKLKITLLTSSCV